MSTKAITAFMVWVDENAVVHVEIGPEMPVFEISRQATLEDISTFSGALSDSARVELIARAQNPQPEPPSNAVKKALGRRKDAR